MELLMVLGILGVVTVMASTWFRHHLLHLRLNGATRTLISDLTAARRTAITQGHEYRIVFLDPFRYAIVADANGNGKADPDEELKTRNLHDHYPGVSVQASNHPVFHPRGTASSLATITVRNVAGSRKITVGITGRISLKEIVRK